MHRRGYTSDGTALSIWLHLLIGTIALIVARYAIWKAKRDLVPERHVGHELEILRDLAGSS
jgi:hypothetical protein